MPSPPREMPIPPRRMPSPPRQMTSPPREDDEAVKGKTVDTNPNSETDSLRV